jgi:hypothetical protein
VIALFPLTEITFAVIPIGRLVKLVISKNLNVGKLYVN